MITLREGVEAALIVGIVAAFLVRQGRGDALRPMWLGVGLAIGLCAGVAVALRIAGEELPERQQEGLATIVALIAVGFVTYMIVWMRRHSRGLRGALEGNVAGALAAGSAGGLVVMAFLAVLREGFETAVFLLAVFQDSSNAGAAGVGGVLGVAAATVLGIALYRGGVKMNLSRFFRITGVVLVLVAAGLLASAVNTASEAGWLTALQSQAVDLSWLVKPREISGSLITGVLGIRPEPTVGEALAYLIYTIPMALYVLWPDRWRLRPSRAGVGSAQTADAAA